MRTDQPEDLTVDVYALAATGEVVRGALPVTALPRLAAAVLDPTGSVDFAFEGYRDALGRPAAWLTATAEVEMQCDRCNGLLRQPVRVDSRFFFVADEAALNAVPIDESEVDALVGSERLDLRQLIEDEAILALPLSPRHADCRMPLADAPPEGEAASASPFAALAGLKPRKH